MHVLVTHGSAADGAALVAQVLVAALREAGHTSVALPCREAGRILPAFDAVLVGGTLREGRWPLGLSWFVWRRAAQLRRAPVWFFSDGPLDGSADREDAGPTAAVRTLMALAAARGHATFCSRLLLGEPASAGPSPDWRSRERIQGWARRVALELAPSPTGPP